ncbi:dihydrodipicolinate synthase family protein [Candidatus Carsonella ruddii]
MKNIVALVTPYKKNGSLNWFNLNFLISYLIFNKIKYILLFGTTGESHNFNLKNYVNLLMYIKKYNIHFFLSINKINIKKIFYLCFIIKINNIKKILISIPCYILPNNLSLFKYYKVINKFGIKNILYNIPKRNGIFINYKLILKFTIKKYLNYMKNSLNNIKNSLIYKKYNIILYSGDDNNLYFCKTINYIGTISVYNNLFPKIFLYINKKINFFFNKINYNINPILIKIFLYKNNLINGCFNLLLFNVEKYFFTQNQT